MGKALKATVDVPAEVERTYLALTGASWPQALDEHLHDGSRLVSAEATDGGGVVMVVSRRLPDGVPGFLQRFTPKDGRVTQTDRWSGAEDGVRHATWEVAFPGSPGSVTGDMTLEPTPQGSRWVVTGEVSARIPLLGGKVEGFLAPLVEQLILRQGEVLRTRVAPS